MALSPPELSHISGSDRKSVKYPKNAVKPRLNLWNLKPKFGRFIAAIISMSAEQIITASSKSFLDIETSSPFTMRIMGEPIASR